MPITLQAKLIPFITVDVEGERRGKRKGDQTSEAEPRPRTHQKCGKRQQSANCPFGTAPLTTVCDTHQARTMFGRTSQKPFLMFASPVIVSSTL